ncbi:hypothetical protein DP125_13655 [Clostridium tetani]|uniref:hypothetical protein n=1 Tax=Clostridium phage phiCT19406C TaxID=1567011 RepID=UPI0005144A2B|nr:hypothetical protein [Clostridium tetani]YP_009218073.1 hypothetical protein phiCT19406C_44 [Clostridium phage phiCT19406C]AJA42867.1 hypothetical protein phiCT19406C_44 [Clostridium phage phiCT19406C]KGI44665.1 hypothetical protein KY54_07255 [Clostridium tetani]KHO30860.1 hypothetical protein OR63_13430 [Clostridium tetani]RXI57498.1 hypothetical protein DP125_13655 [Clostridium tetani]RXI62340.1 hypothetical protein DP132_06685 [Clostridium tetani]
MKVKELEGILREGICILNKEKKELFVPLITNAYILINHNDEVLWEKYGEKRVKEIYNENEMILVEIE